jgi:hypothetical protein
MEQCLQHTPTTTSNIIAQPFVRNKLQELTQNQMSKNRIGVANAIVASNATTTSKTTIGMIIVANTLTH